MFITQLPKEGPRKDRSMICVEMFCFWKLSIMWESTLGGVHQLVCRQINIRDLQHAPKNSKFVSFKCIFKEGVVNCIQLEDPYLPPVFSFFRKCFKVARLGQRAEGRYDLVAILATASYEWSSQPSYQSIDVCSLCDSGASIHYGSERNSDFILQGSIRSSQRTASRLFGRAALSRNEQFGCQVLYLGD